MKNKILLACLFFLVLHTTSCKKEMVPAIVGKWMSTSVYTEQHGWQTVPERGTEVITFGANTKFSIFSDIPEGAGIYNYSRVSNELQLQFEPDFYGPARISLTKVETLTNDKLVLESSSQVNGVIYKHKKEYTRVNY